MTLTYLFFCASCDHWSTGQTLNLREYRFSCKYCSNSKKVLSNGNMKVIFKGPYAEYDAVLLCKEINVVKQKIGSEICLDFEKANQFRK